MHSQVDSTSSSSSWANAMPAAQGLYDPSLEKDACGVGFVVDIHGRSSHKILKDSESLLCNMTHRGAVGADIRDGDGAGVMTAIPHPLLYREFSRIGVTLPPPGKYATGNIFFHSDDTIRAESIRVFDGIAQSLGLSILGWRTVPTNGSILGPVARSREPCIMQPAIVLANNQPEAAATTTDDDADQQQHQQQQQLNLERKLYSLRKKATHAITLAKWFYTCSLSTRTIIYKGLLAPSQVPQYFADLGDPLYVTHFALVHSRFSTNTFPSWDRAHPMRWIAHNGEINTLRGNKNWMRAREGVMHSAKLGSDLEHLYPVIEEGGSDSSALDNVLELLVLNGELTLPEAVMMLMPEAWQGKEDIDDPAKIGFYKWAACLMEPWDGPALVTFSDGRYCGANLDRNGLRPCRYYITKDDVMICASEVGAVKVASEDVAAKGRLQPGKMLLVDTQAGRIIDDSELKASVSVKRPFAEWVKRQRIQLSSVLSSYIADTPAAAMATLNGLDSSLVAEDPRLRAFGFTLEQVNLILMPMALGGKEALGSMGNDVVLACMATQPRLIYDYFRELFAQVTNPPIDPIRERIVMSLECYVGPEGNILEMAESQAHRLALPSPVLTLEELAALRAMDRTTDESWKVATIDITFNRDDGVRGYVSALERICSEAAEAIEKDGYKIIILSDRGVSPTRVAISTLIAAGGVHHHLVKKRLRTRAALIVETAEAREVHHVCVLLGYGVDAICPYLAIELFYKLHREGAVHDLAKNTPNVLVDNYKHAIDDGILKVMSKMGISTLQSYKGAQIFEALGIDDSVIRRCFTGTASRIKGATFAILAADSLAYHERAYPSATASDLIPRGLPETGEYHWRHGGEPHMNEPAPIASLQDAVRTKNQTAYSSYSESSLRQIRNCTLRGMLDFDYGRPDIVPVPIEEVESWNLIARRFVTGAMSFGSISYEAHTALAAAMNQIGGKSNTGEGGEDPERSKPLADGTLLRSAIKQIASGRFGVTSYYLADADELQIKMAQGAKPGEGGELAGSKVSEDIARTRKTTPYVGLISPPPLHDIYSIEDLKQLIYDLKSANPVARVSVKLVSEVGVGIIAAGVAKAKADHILISGHDGGTGASRWTGIKHAGLPWELGLAETHQTLVLNDLRGRVILQTDGQLKTGRDVAIACLLGAEEWGFATTPLIALGCTMMKACHTNKCPVGIATQDPELRKKFAGQPEDVINFFYFVAEELRGIMARLGFRSISEMVGRSDMLVVDQSIRNAKTDSLDLTPILTPAYRLRSGVATSNIVSQDHELDKRLDNQLIAGSRPALERGQRVQLSATVGNVDRSVGTTLAYHVSYHYGERGLPDDTIHVKLHGSAGQSFGAFVASGITLELEGDANDYVGKGLSGGRLVLYPPRDSTFRAEDNIIIGNVCLYGATGGAAFFRGMAGERFAVRNSGAVAVVEGCGDHGCEYMTGGRVIILGSTGRNFAAGMSGGIAYIIEESESDLAAAASVPFAKRCNHEMVELETVDDADEIAFLRRTITDHQYHTGSEKAARVLSRFDQLLPRVIKVMPTDYKRILEKERQDKLKPAESIAVQPPAAPLKPAVTAHEPALLDIEDSMVDEEAALARQGKLDKLRGFMKYKRRGDPYRPAKRRVKDWNEINARLDPDRLKVQAARCMDCGVPFCQSDQTGCPIGNVIPKWNDLIFKGQWQEALERLLRTNNFPEFTGRVCPAPCEGACVAGINELPVSIKSIECAIIDKGFEMGWMIPSPPAHRTGRTIAIVGSGPAGLAAADMLNKAGHSVTVYDRNDRIGGLLMYGIPNMKLDKRIVQRRVDLLEAEGIKFVTNAHVGVNVDAVQVRESHDALLLATGATWPRDLPIPGRRELNGIHFAMEFLQQNTKALLDNGGSTLPSVNNGNYLSAKGKKVIVIGGGDTGCDCLATATRHGATSVVNFELLPQPSVGRDPHGTNPWPEFPRVFKVDYGHAEVEAQYGRDPREYCVLSKRFVGDKEGNLVGIETVRVEWTRDGGLSNKYGKWNMREIPGTEQFFEADMILLAMGFMGPEQKILEQLGLKANRFTNIETVAASGYATAVPGVYAAGDCRRGQSLIVWGINEGRQAAREIDQYLVGETSLPVTGGIQQRSLESLAHIKMSGLTLSQSIAASSIAGLAASPLKV